MRSPRERRPPDMEFAFAADSTAPSQARHALDALLEGSRASLADDVRLVTSELVSNVVLHTGSDGSIAAWNDDPFVIEVSDHDRRRPSAQDLPTSAGGRGLRMVEAIADSWGIDVMRHGKVIWAAFGRPAGDVGQPTSSRTHTDAGFHGDRQPSHAQLLALGWTEGTAEV